MAPIADERLRAGGGGRRSRKVTPAAIRVVDVPGTGAQLLGNLRQVDALLAVLDDLSGTRNPGDDLETLELELLVADRDHVERRLERVRSRRSRATRAQGRGRGARARPRPPRGGSAALRSTPATFRPSSSR